MNQQDDLERFVSEHRDAFDKGAPGENVWNRLEQSLAADAQQGTRRPAVVRRLSVPARRWMSAAAILLVFISMAAFVRTYQVKAEMKDAAIPADLQEAQGYYEHSISIKIQHIKSMNAISGADTSLVQVFGERDDEYQRLRKALQENPGDAHVRAAFVEYYRSRLEVLNHIEKQVAKNKTRQ